MRLHAAMMRAIAVDQRDQAMALQAYRSHRSVHVVIRRRHVHCRERRKRTGAGLSQPAGALADRLCARRPERHRGAHHRPAPVGEARPAVRDRDPAGRRRQSRDRRRWRARRPTATRCSASVTSTPSTRRSTRSCRSTSSATSCRSPAWRRRPNILMVHPSVPVKIGGGIHRLSEGQSRTSSAMPRPATARRRIWRPSCSRR